MKNRVCGIWLLALSLVLWCQCATNASPGPRVLVHFYAKWCPICSHMAPAVSRFANAFGSSVQVVNVDVDDPSTYGPYLPLLKKRNGGGIPYTLLLNSTHKTVLADWRGEATYEQLVEGVGKEKN